MTDRQKYDVLFHAIRQNGGEEKQPRRQADDGGSGMTFGKSGEGVQAVDEEQALWKLVEMGLTTSDRVAKVIAQKRAYHASHGQAG